MVTLSLVDASGDVIAMSTRPLIVPYHSPLVSLVTVLWHLPTYVLGASETDVVTLLMMNNFREARSELAAVQMVEVTLSSGGMDVESCNLSIIPLPSGFTYVQYDTIHTLCTLHIYTMHFLHYLLSSANIGC